MNELSPSLTQFLLDQPETSEGLHIVSASLFNGRVFDDVAITDCSVVVAVRGRSFVPFDARDIVRVEVTHRRWGSGWQSPHP